MKLFHTGLLHIGILIILFAPCCIQLDWERCERWDEYRCGLETTGQHNCGETCRCGEDPREPHHWNTENKWCCTPPDTVCNKTGGRHAAVVCPQGKWIYNNQSCHGYCKHYRKNSSKHFENNKDCPIPLVGKIILLLRDWDETEEKLDITEYRQRKNEVCREMTGAVFLHWIFNVILLIPIMVTGAAIISRHRTLLYSIQPLPEETQSYNTVILLMSVSLPMVTLAALLDWKLNRLYVDRFHPWVGLLEEEQVSEDSGSNPDIDKDRVAVEPEINESENDRSGRSESKSEETKWEEGEEMDQEDRSTGIGTKNYQKNGLEQGIKKGSKEEMESMEGFPETETQKGI